MPTRELYDIVSSTLAEKDTKKIVRFCKSVNVYANTHYVVNRPGTIAYILTELILNGKITYEQIEAI